MKKIFRIARTELSILFYSPIAWLLLVIFLIQSGLTYTDILYNQETSQQLDRPLSVLSKVLFAGDKGLFKAVQDNLYLYIPLLTMGLLSRELRSGSIKLLLSSPVRISEIIIGKFFSMMIYAFLLILVLVPFIISAYFSIEGLDITLVLGGLLGLYLMICVYASIGIFMSSLTSYQIVAAISTLAALAALNFIDQIGQNIDAIRDFTHWLSLSGRTENFINGLIISRDVIYFLLVIILFLSLTIIRLNNGRQVISFYKRLVRYGVLILSFLLIGFVSSQPALTAYLDTTRFKDRTITPNSQALIKGIKGPLTITSYVNVVHYTAPYGAPKNRISDKSHFENYQRFLPDMQMNYVVYYDTTDYNYDTTLTLKEKAIKASEAYGFNFNKLMTPEEIRRKIDLSPEQNRFVRFIEINGRETPLRMFDDIIAYPGESETDAAIKRLLTKPSKLGFLTGNDERSIDRIGDKDYKVITTNPGTRNSAINQGFEVSEFMPDTLKEIPLNISALVLADPKSKLSDSTLEKIKQYLKNGGNMIIAGEPGRQAILNPLLHELGLEFKKGTLLQESDNYELDLIQAKFTGEAKRFGFSFFDKAIVTMPGAMAIDILQSNHYSISPLLVTDETHTWNKTESFDLNTEKISFDSVSDKRISAPVAVALERKFQRKEQKIIVCGDADFFSNVEMIRFSPNNVNASFVMRMLKWMSDGQYPVSLDRPKNIDTRITVTRKEINLQKWIFLGMMPLLLIFIGVISLYRRKEK